MTSNGKRNVGMTACVVLAISGLACSDSGDKRAVANSSGSHYRASDASSTYPQNQNNSYSGITSYEADQPRRVVRVAADDQASQGGTARATYDAGTTRRTAYAPSPRMRSAMTAPEAPPPLPPEQMSGTPRDGKFWVGSHWRWDGNRYVLEPGRMEQLRSNQLYHPAKWTQTDQGWEFTPAYWD